MTQGENKIVIRGETYDLNRVRSIWLDARKAYREDCKARDEVRREKRELNERLRYLRMKEKRLNNRRTAVLLAKADRKHRIETLIAYGLHWENAARALNCKSNTLRDDIAILQRFEFARVDQEE